MKSGRILIFDIIRIVCILLIVYAHYHILIFEEITKSFFRDGFTWIFPNSISLLSVYGIIFISGAVLELNYPKISGINEYIRFIGKRIVRIYPAYWITLIFALILISSNLNQTPEQIFMQFTGFYTFLGLGADTINQMGWFIGTIVSLYLIFPIISSIMKKNPYLTLTILFLVSIISRDFFLYHSTYEIAYRFLPICNLFEFGFGIFIVIQGFYIKTESPEWIAWLSEFTFYLFLIHLVVIQYVGPIIYFGNWYWGYYLQTVAEVLIVSLILMKFDEIIQNAISDRIRSNQNVQRA